MPVPCDQVQVITAFKICTNCANVAKFQGLYVIMTKVKVVRASQDQLT